jgi:hypothetical protein
MGKGNAGQGRAAARQRAVGKRVGHDTEPGQEQLRYYRYLLLKLCNRAPFNQSEILGNSTKFFAMNQWSS